MATEPVSGPFQERHHGADEPVDVIVVGAGFAGLYMLYKLREQGLQVRVLEAGDGVGGTWYWNRYPGARCDVASMDYSYSFSPELEQEWTWSERFATQPEILRYLEHVADRFDLRRDITFRTRVEKAEYDEDNGCWQIGTDTGEQITGQFCVMATGCLSRWKAPDIPGVGDFTGQVYYTGRWPHDEVDFTGSRVAVIGTGSSGVQLTPLVAERAAEVTVFQRTPAYCLPAHNRPLRSEEVAAWKADYPQYRQRAKESPFGVPLPLPTSGALEVSDAERERTYREAFESGTLVGLLFSYHDLYTDLEANATASRYVAERIREAVGDDGLASALTPSYPIGSKRPCLDTGYWKTFTRDDVSLVDLRETPIERITARGVRTTAREYEVDSIVFATGFDAMTGALAGIDIRGRQGRRLHEHWADGARTYLGLAVTGFPNLFTVTGPGSPSVLSNMVVSIEQHVEWIADAIAAVRAGDHDALEATAEAEETWTTHVDEVSAGSIYVTADSWYMGANVPGKPRQFLVYIGGVGEYRAACDKVAKNGYEGFTLSHAAGRPPSAPS